MLRDPFSKKIQSLLIHDFRLLITLHSYKCPLRQLSTELELPETSKGRKLFKTSGIHIWDWAQHGSATWHGGGGGGGGSFQATQFSPIVHKCFVRDISLGQHISFQVTRPNSVGHGKLVPEDFLFIWFWSFPLQFGLILPYFMKMMKKTHQSA